MVVGSRKELQQLGSVGLQCWLYYIFRPRRLHSRVTFLYITNYSNIADLCRGAVGARPTRPPRARFSILNVSLIVYLADLARATSILDGGVTGSG